jgi:ABC-type phosphate transport system ATPase subunit
MQRAALAVALALNPDVLLLDGKETSFVLWLFSDNHSALIPLSVYPPHPPSEPTSALDPDSTLLVEKTLKLYTCVWITHSPEQSERVSTKTLTLGRGRKGSSAVVETVVNGHPDEEVALNMGSNPVSA